MALITYEDKVPINENPNVANINKITASDMNEIKNAINQNVGKLKYISLLEEYIQASSTINEFVYGNLLENYSNFDFLLVRVSSGSSGVGEGIIEIIIPEYKENRVYFYSSDNYNARLAIRLDNDNQIGIQVRGITGWQANNIYINNVYGIKI